MIDDEAVQQDEAVIEGDNAEVADQVDDLAVGHLTTDHKSPQPAGVEGDPIGDAEDHIASLDMDAEREKAADLMKKL
jgi:hypothetical protein